MLFWAAVFAFALPLIIFIAQAINSKSRDEERLEKIRNRLNEIERNK